MSAHLEPFGLWWPDYEADPLPTYERLAKRAKDVDVVYPYCGQKRTCVQAGGHVGVWPLRLAQSFKRVITFEPDHACYMALINNAPEIQSYGAALGAVDGPVHLRLHRRSGNAKIVTEPNARDVVVRCMTVDSLYIKDCDLICLDVEGSEVEALKGAARTIAECAPAIYVEMLPRHPGELAGYLHSIGYEMAAQIHSDAVWVKTA